MTTTTSSPGSRLKIGIGLPTLGPSGSPTSMDIGAAAQHVETLGFDSVLAADLMIGDGTPALEATVALTAAALATERVSIGFGVLALPLRPVVWLAAQVQGLQHLSNDRVLLGVGSGGMPNAPFWSAVGVDARARGRLTDAALKVLPSLIAGEPTRLEEQPGQPTVTLTPAAPTPPILVGGNSVAAIRRAAAYGDGWFPSQIAPDTLASGVAKLREFAAERGRPAPVVHVGGLTILSEDESVSAARAARASFVRALPGEHGIYADEAMATVTASPAEAAEHMAAYAAAGAASIGISPGIDSIGENWIRQCDRVAEARALLS
jgi:alkanesulfonate monooxygenase SsuD/methylene tetrahydromethanopterin reductase-like flavin-dependent oxidoreductase (luciferase family)